MLSPLYDQRFCYHQLMMVNTNCDFVNNKKVWSKLFFTSWWLWTKMVNLSPKESDQRFVYQLMMVNKNCERWWFCKKKLKVWSKIFVHQLPVSKNDGRGGKVVSKAEVFSSNTFNCCLNLFHQILLPKNTFHGFVQRSDEITGFSPDQLMCWGIGLEDTRTLSDTPGYYYCDFFWGAGGAKWRRYTHTVRYSRWNPSHFDDHIIFLHSGAMWALGLVVLLVTVAGVLALLVYVLKWWHSRCFFTCKYILTHLTYLLNCPLGAIWTDPARSFWPNVAVLAECQTLLLLFYLLSALDKHGRLCYISNGQNFVHTSKWRTVQLRQAPNKQIT